MNEYANGHIAMLEPDEKREDDNIAMIPVFINGNEACAYITLNEARKRGILNLVEVGEEDDLSQIELRARMKQQFCELLILEKMYRPDRHRKG
jgi:hypothetical protein